MYFIILNIPALLKCEDLRNYFSYLIEQEAYECFHYCDRTAASLKEYLETHNDIYKRNYLSEKLSKEIINELNLVVNCNINSNQIEKVNLFKLYCCFLKIKSKYADIFKEAFHRKFWITCNGEIIPIRCIIYEIEPLVRAHKDFISNTRPNPGTGKNYFTKRDDIEKNQSISLERIEMMMEFKMGLEIPQGNIGTPTEFFKHQLKLCKLSSSLIKHLGLDFSSTLKRKAYSRTHLDYNTSTDYTPGTHQTVIFTSNGDLIPGYFDARFNKPLLKKSSMPLIENVPGDNYDDGDEKEEWERFEDKTKEKRYKEKAKGKLFESEIEQVWEKGGSGLVFYTDAQFWRLEDRESEESDADDWDTQGYNNVDERDLQLINSLNELKTNQKTYSQFGKGKVKRCKERKQHIKNTKHFDNKIKRLRSTKSLTQTRDKGESQAIGDFEKHTKGIGRRLMESLGWQDGDGLGRDRRGLAQPLQRAASKYHLERTGLGYSVKKGKYINIPTVETREEHQRRTNEETSDANKQEQRLKDSIYGMKNLSSYNVYPHVIQFQKSKTLFQSRLVKEPDKFPS